MPGSIIPFPNRGVDQTVVLCAVRGGMGTWWDRVEGGHCLADDHGGNRWIDSDSSAHSYLRLTADPEAMAQLIESIMLNRF